MLLRAELGGIARGVPDCIRVAVAPLPSLAGAGTHRNATIVPVRDELNPQEGRLDHKHAQCPAVPVNVVTLRGDIVASNRWEFIFGGDTRPKFRSAVVANASTVPTDKPPKS
jgi:hypothetical protein